MPPPARLPSRSSRFGLCSAPAEACTRSAYHPETRRRAEQIAGCLDLIERAVATGQDVAPVLKLSIEHNAGIFQPGAVCARCGSNIVKFESSSPELVQILRLRDRLEALQLL